MGIVIPFRPTRSRQRPADDRPSAGGEVLIFTGVRYERGQPPDAAPAKGKRPIRSSGRGRRPRRRAAS